jgi:membrane-associated phospholipid phosphatase
VFLTESARNLVNAGASVLPETPNPAEVVNRDCMPSGHTMMTLMTMIMAFSMRSGLRWYYLVLGSSLIFATVYLRYHYVVDVLAGMLWAMAVLAAIEPLRNSLHKRGWVAI